MDNNKKCSLKQHSEKKALSYCQQCDIYMCNTCAKIHSELCQKHIPYDLDSDKQIFTGICRTENHFEKLNYFCRKHNMLCCAACITKIKGKGNGQHTDCNICYIEDIKDEKKKKLKENIIRLEKLSNNIEDSVKNLKELFEKINGDKEEIKKSIQTIFTKIRTELNEREREHIIRVDFFKFPRIDARYKEEIYESRYGENINI